MSTKKKVIEVNVEQVNTALDNYFSSVDTAKKAQLSVQETVQAFSKAVGFDWWKFGLKALSEKHPEIANVFKENVLSRYLNDNVGIDSVKMGDIEYHFSAENILYDKAKKLKEDFPNSELYAYLNDNKTGLRRKVSSFTNHAYNDLKELSKSQKGFVNYIQGKIDLLLMQVHFYQHYLKFLEKILQQNILQIF